jgi:hypothetical protein
MQAATEWARFLGALSGFPYGSERCVGSNPTRAFKRAASVGGLSYFAVSSVFRIRPLPPHCLQGGGKIFLVGSDGCLTAGKPVPPHASHFISSDISARPTDWREPQAATVHFFAKSFSLLLCRIANEPVTATRPSVGSYLLSNALVESENAFVVQTLNATHAQSTFKCVFALTKPNQHMIARRMGGPPEFLESPGDPCRAIEIVVAGF